MALFEENVINSWGNQGSVWLKKLPSIIEYLSKQWSLSHITPADKMNYNYVAFAYQKSNTPVVLKISCDKQLIESEYKALHHFKGKGSIQAIHINKTQQALLLERAIPGDPLKNFYASNIERINIYTDIVKQIASIPLIKDNYTHVKQWCETIFQIKDWRIEKFLINKSKKLVSLLLSTANHEYLCHGDLHLENIIRHGAQWQSIDPKGIIGEMAFEAAAFDLINQQEWDNSESMQHKMNSRINLLADSLNVDKDRLIAWIFLRTMISTQWFIEDNNNPNAMKMLSLAKFIYPLVK